MKSLLRIGVALLVAAAAFTVMAGQTSMPKFLLNLKGRTGTTTQSTETTNENGWVNWKQDNLPYAPNSSEKYFNSTGGVVASTVAGLKFRVNQSGGNFRSEWGNPTGKTFDDGSYTNIFGECKASLIEEVKSSLNLPAGTDFTTNVFDCGLGNGGNTGGKGEFLGLNPAKKYVMYVGICRHVQNTGNKPNAYGGFKLETGKYGAITKLQYVVTDALNKTVNSETINTVKTAAYTDFAPETRVGPNAGGLMIVRYVGKPNASGQIQFDLGGVGVSSDGARAGIAFVAISEIVDGVVLLFSRIGI